MLVLNPKTGLKYGVVCKELNDFYREIGCDTIDITARQIGEKVFDVIVDDEGLLKEDPADRVSAAYLKDRKLSPALVGTLVFALHDDAGNMVDLTMEDEMMIASHVAKVAIVNTNDKSKSMTENYCVILRGG